MRTRTPVKSKWLTLEALERRHILRVVKEQRGNLTRAALALAIDRRTLYRKLEKFQTVASSIQVYQTSELGLTDDLPDQLPDEWLTKIA